MKKYRVTYRPTERADMDQAHMEEVYADGWRVDPNNDAILLYQREEGREVPVLDIPKSRFMRINEIPG